MLFGWEKAPDEIVVCDGIPLAVVREPRKMGIDLDSIDISKELLWMGFDIGLKTIATSIDTKKKG